MEKKIELLTILVASLSIISMNLSIMQVNKEVLKRLALNQKRIDTVKNLVRILRGAISDIEKFLATKMGYEIRDSSQNLDEQLQRDYDNEDTGF